MRCLFLIFLAVTRVSVADEQALATEAQATIPAFAQQLQTTVKQAMQSGGPVAAVEACQLLAPQIASEHSKEPWRVGRTALKLRNPANAPDDWEKKVLQQFSRDMAAGKSITDLRHGEVVGKEYRYMQAIATGEPCLACHGQNLKPDVKAVLDRKYPEDQATGFALGDLRGAFTLRKVLE